MASHFVWTDATAQASCLCVSALSVLNYTFLNGFRYFVAQKLIRVWCSTNIPKNTFHVDTWPRNRSQFSWLSGNWIYLARMIMDSMNVLIVVSLLRRIIGKLDQFPGNHRSNLNEWTTNNTFSFPRISKIYCPSSTNTILTIFAASSSSSILNYYFQFLFKTNIQKSSIRFSKW